MKGVDLTVFIEAMALLGEITRMHTVPQIPTVYGDRRLREYKLSLQSRHMSS